MKPDEHVVRPPPGLNLPALPTRIRVRAIRSHGGVGDGGGQERTNEAAEGEHGVDKGQAAVGVGEAAGPGVGVRVLVGHAEGLEGKAEEEERLGRPGPKTLGEELEGRAEGEERGEGEVGGQEGVRGGGQEPAGEYTGISGEDVNDRGREKNWGGGGEGEGFT